MLRNLAVIWIIAFSAALCFAQMSPDEAEARLQERIAERNAATTRPVEDVSQISNAEQSARGIDLGIQFVSMHEASAYDAAKVLPRWDAGVLVTDLDPTGPAAKAGLEIGDIIASIRGEPIRTGDDLFNFMKSARRGMQYSIIYYRFVGLHVGMSEDELDNFIKVHNGVASVVSQAVGQSKVRVPPPGSSLSAQMGYLMQDAGQDTSNIRYLTLHYTIPDLDENGNQRATYVTSSETHSTILGDRSSSVTSREMLSVDRDSVAALDGERVVAIGSANGESVDVKGRTIAIDRGAWERVMRTVKGQPTDAAGPLSEKNGDRFLEPWVDNQALQAANFPGERRGQAFLGVLTRDFTQEIMEPRHGAEVMYVYPNSPAARAGIQVGDVIVKWSDMDIGGNRDINKLISFSPGMQGQISVMRRFGYAYKIDTVPMVLLNKSQFVIDIPANTPPDLRQLIEDGEIARQQDLRTLDEMIAHDQSSDHDKHLFMEELRAQIIKARGSYLPPISASVGSIGEFRYDSSPLMGTILQIIDPQQALLEVKSNDGSLDMLLWWRGDVSEMVDGQEVDLSGAWKITGTHTYVNLLYTNHTIFEIQRFSIEDALKGMGTNVPTLPEPRADDSDRSITAS